MKNLEIHSIDISTSLPLQYADEGIRAGFPSPAQDYMEPKRFKIKEREPKRLVLIPLNNPDNYRWRTLLVYVRFLYGRNLNSH